MLDGDIVEGELEIGQVANILKEVKPLSEIVFDLLRDYQKSIERLS